MLPPPPYHPTTPTPTHPPPARGARLAMPTKDTLPLVAEELGAASFVESLDDGGGEKKSEGDGETESASKRVIRKLATGTTDELDASTELQEYQGVIGRPGVDFPVLQSIPITDFSCRKVRSSGYYADLSTDCQVFHICDGGRKISFLCPNGTIFRQSHLICDWWFKVECERSIDHYEESAEQLAADQKIYQARAEAIAKAMNQLSGQKPSDPPAIQADASSPSNTSQTDQYTGDDSKQQAQYFVDNPGLYRPRSFVKSNTTPFSSSETSQIANFSSTPSPFSKPIHVVSAQEMAAHLNSQRLPENYQYQQSAQPGNQPAQSQNLQSTYQYQQAGNNNQPTQSQNLQNNYQYQQVNTNNQPAQSQTLQSNYQYQQASNNNQPAYQQSEKNNLQTHQQAGNNYQQAVDNNQLNYQPPVLEAKSAIGSGEVLSPQIGVLNQQPQPVAQSQYAAPLVQQPQPGANSQNIFSTRSPHPVPTHTQAQFSQNPVNSVSTTHGPLYNSYTSPAPPSPSSQYISSTTEPTFQFNDINEHQQLAETAGFASSSGSAYSRVYQQKLKSTSRDSATTPSGNVYYSYATNHNSVNEPDNFSASTETPVFSAKVLPEEQYSFVELLRTVPPNRTYHFNATPTDSSVSFDLKPSVPTVARTSQVNLPAAINQRLVDDLNLDYPNYYPTPSGVSNTDLPLINGLQPFSDDILLYDTGKKPTPTPSDPKLLHSLALYFATANTNAEGDTPPTVSWVKTEITTNLPGDGLSISGVFSQTTATDSTTAASTELTPADDLPPLLTKTTKDSYSYLFNKRDNSTYETPYNTYNTYNSSASDLDSVRTLKEPSNNGLEYSETRGLVQGGSPNTSEDKVSSETAKIRDSVDLRELAKVFSRALSAYLEDPENFRRVLSEVRPTEPTTLVTPAELTSSEDEVLAFSEDTKSFPQRPTAEITPTVYGDFASTNSDSTRSESGRNYKFENNNKTAIPQLSNELTPPFVSYDGSNSLTDTEAPILFASDINNFIGNVSATGPEYDNLSRQGEASETSYFPTAGGANDQSRPRYGGFHNNSAPVTPSYSPYGVGVAKQRTGQPISEATTPQFTVSPMLDFTETGTEIQTTYPATPNSYVGAQDVNNLVSNFNYDQNVDYASYNNAGFTGAETSPTRATPSGKNENLIASGSQSFVSRDNYLQYQNGFGQQQPRNQLQGPSNTYRTLPKEAELDQTYKSAQQRKPETYFTAAPAYSSPLTPSINAARINNELRSYYTPTANDVDATEAPTTFWSSTPSSVQPTTYHPPTTTVLRMTQSQRMSVTVKGGGSPRISNVASRPSDSVPSATQSTRITSRNYETQSTRWVSATAKPDYGHTSFRRYTQSTLAPSTAQSVSTPVPSTTRGFANSSVGFEAKAKEMFGNLNETSADRLMDVMNQAESNVTLRRLVLLLVNDKGSRNKKTTTESRSQLIEALLKTSEKSSSASVIHPKVAAPSTSDKQTKHRKEPRRDELAARATSRFTATTYAQSPSPASTTTTTTTPRPTTTNGDAWSTRTSRRTASTTTTTTSPWAKYQSTNDLATDSDSRAVELLKSLYTLAARWG
nr:PREDICTED: mucin-5AC [Bemisia tabaci]